ncbi:RsmD family RNA methyltransferase [Acholeplasma vituli]|uniref:RsmD family RNA methyltransferase n=1 Tax=Paracholeplasma vituli TaxID=69473 RepID=A0ABT2PYZ8_9MOLU|nr:RsmD family RNA methyltransferase [Paracholeplasma vituli]MCU0104888.1 RsmD family RNA methyltransferase [Paracholeplasma vituli]
MKQVKLKLIAGKYKGKTLVSYSEDTRESAQIVKGAVFNMLFEVNGRVLDLFAGSGAYGFEALSRGASAIYLNDQHPHAIKSLKANNQALEANAVITAFEYKDAIRYYERQSIRFDYIFLDPPYAFEIMPIIEAVIPILNENGKIIIEIEKKNSCPELADLTLLKDRVHGIKRIGIYQK